MTSPNPMVEPSQLPQELPHTIAVTPKTIAPDNDDSADAAWSEALNQGCFCISLDQAALLDSLQAELGDDSLHRLLLQRCPHVFAAQPVFVATAHLRRMAEVVRAVETVVALPAWREQVLARAPTIVQSALGDSRGVFFGYDFHLNRGRLGLIEVNTNAGGAMLNIVLARAQRACCAAMDSLLPGADRILAFEHAIVAMFRQEWQRSGRTVPLTRIALVDAQPQQQYLYPEFLLFKSLFERHGIQTTIADPTELEWRDGQLWHGPLAIDLVYNRLTDFYLEQPDNAVLREAVLQRGVVLTPHPQAHALYADKSHLCVFSDAGRLQELGVTSAVQDILLAHVPRTERVQADQAQSLWERRNTLFFKPIAGYGSRATYRGDKLTRRVWEEILAGDYVAQALIAPGQRQIDEGPAAHTLKFDLRAYAYDAKVQWTAARLYQGQTTNFRTPGGGFAPVYSTAGTPAEDPDCTTQTRTIE